MSVIEVTDATFESEVLQSDLPVLVDFWAAWCGPCKMMSPIIDQVAEEVKGKAKVCKVNVDANPESSAKYRVQSIPTMILFKAGRVEATTVGARPKQELLKMLDL
jgi:thioredoxin 1